MKQIEKGKEDLRGIPFLFYLVFCSNARFAPNPAYRQRQRGGGYCPEKSCHMFLLLEPFLHDTDDIRQQFPDQRQISLGQVL